MPNPVVRIGFMGATGYVGQQYRREICDSQDVTLVRLCARRRQLLEEAARIDGALSITQDWREIVEDASIDLVVIATPDRLHYEPLLACAQARKHVVCEKPIASDAVQACEMSEAYANLDLVHFVPFWSRYAAPFVRAKTLLSEGLLGELRAVFYRWYAPRPTETPITWRDDAAQSPGGSIADVGSHAYDMVRWILNENASEVLVHSAVTSRFKPDHGDISLSEALDLAGSATAGTSPQAEATSPDYANIAWKFPSGAIGGLVLSHAHFLRKGIAPEIEIHGSEGSLAVNRVTGDLTFCDGQGQIRTLENLPDQRCNRFETRILPIVRAAILGEEIPEYPNLEDGYQAQRFIDAAIRSSGSGTWEQLNHSSP